MDRYPALGLIVKHGYLGAILLALAAMLLGGLALQAWLGWIAAPIGLVIGGLVYLVARAFVELVIILTEMLVPR